MSSVTSEPSSSNTAGMEQCPACGKHFESEYHLEIHRFQAHVDATHACLLCFRATGKQKLVSHIIRHLGSKLHHDDYKAAQTSKTVESLYNTIESCDCRFCDATIRDKQSLIQHITNRHIIVEMICDVKGCGQRIQGGKAAMNLHKQNLHRDASEYYKQEWLCDPCQQNCKNKISYEKHLNTKSHKATVEKLSSENPDTSVILPCTQDGCSFQTAYESLFKAHLYDQHGVGVKCAVQDCKKPFHTNQANLTRHMNEVHGGTARISCTVSGCDESFTRKDSLKRHLRDIHGK